MKSIRLSWCLIFIFFHSAIFAQDGGTTKSKNEKSTYKLIKKIVYSEIDDEELFLDAYVHNAEGKHPAILVVHGGAWRRGNRSQLSGYARALAERGFCCFAIDYRLAPKHKFPAQIEDCRTAIKWIRQNAKEYQVDAKRIGAIGYSAGGHLATLLGTTGEGPSKKNGNIDLRIQAVAAGGAPTDFRMMPDKGNWAEYWMGGNLETVPEKFKLASAAAFVDPDDPPTFFFHGEKDSLVPMIWAASCHNELKKAGVKSVMHKVEGAGHIQAARDTTALTKAYEFLAEELKVSVDETKTR